MIKSEYYQQTVIAQCTPQGSGSLALLRICGENVFEIADRIGKLPENKKLSQLASHTVIYGSVVDAEGRAIDQVMFIVMHGPKTFTGQDTIEITCHNNQFIVQNIIQVVLQAGARLAENGEFSKRAFLNNKIDLVQAEAINELIQANNQYALKQSLAQLKGSFSAKIIEIEKQLTHCLALSDASFEFLDDENISFGSQIQQLLFAIRSTIDNLLQNFDQQKTIRQGIRIALIGSVNAGKSSLFNALLGSNRAIVNAQAGTTRDVIEGGLYVKDYYWTLIDTAGLRSTDDVIEQEGIKRSYEQAALADIILLIYDKSRRLNQQELPIYEQLIKDHAKKIILVANKSDFPQIQSTLNDATPLINVSAYDTQTINNLHANITEKIAHIFSAQETPFLLNQRHFNLLTTLKEELLPIQKLLQAESIAYELVSYHLKDSIKLLSQLTGKNISDNAMNAIFKEFCIGK